MYDNSLKQLLRQYVRQYCDRTNSTQKAVATAMGFENTNNLTMVMSPSYSNNLSANRFFCLQEVLGLSDSETLALFQARSDLAHSSPRSLGVPMSPETMERFYTLRRAGEVSA